MQTAELYRKMASLLEEGTPFVLVSVLEAVGSTPRKGGAKMIVLPDGRTIDTIGGGKVEAQATADALEALKRGVSRVVEYELRPAGEHALGMVCGGQTKVSLDVHSPGSTLLIIGAGHIGQKLASMAKLLDFRVVVLDARPEFANTARFPEADEVIVGHPGDAADLVRMLDHQLEHERSVQGYTEVIYETVLTYVEWTITDGIRSGEFREVDAHEVACMVVGMMEGLVLQWLFSKDAIELAEAFAMCERFVDEFLMAADAMPLSANGSRLSSGVAATG